MYQSDTMSRVEKESIRNSTKEPAGLSKESNITAVPTTTIEPGLVPSSNTDQTKEEIKSVQIVTGANFSGKSVYLKQIALIVYMAHIGR